MNAKTLTGLLTLSLLIAGPCNTARATARFGGIPTPPHVTITYGPCPDAPEAAGCASYDPPVIYLRDRDPFTRQHELGHLADNQLLTELERARLQPLLGAPAGTPWDNGTDPACTPGHVCPSERFADAYATCRLRYWPGFSPSTRSTMWESGGYGYDPRTNKRQARVCYAIRAFLTT